MLVQPLARRAVLTSLAALAAMPLQPSSAANRKCKTESNPSFTLKTCIDTGLDADGRLAGCAADENCIASSAVGNPSKFSPPWAPSQSQEAGDPDRAFRSLCGALGEEPGVEIVERDATRRYVRATATAQVPPDGTIDIEFRVNDEATTLLRSATRESLFVYPLTQPVNSQTEHAERLKRIRQRLGWKDLGYAGDSEMERDMGLQQAQNFFGLRLRGVSVPEEYED